MTDPAAAEYRAGGWDARSLGRLLVLIPLSLCSLLVAIYPINALPQIGEHFQTDQVAWVPGLFSLVSALLCPVLGKLADRFGKKRMIVIVSAIVIVGLVISAVAPTYTVLLIGRALQAPSLAFAFLIPSLVRDIFPTRTIAVAASVATSAGGFLAIVVQFLSGAVLDTLGYAGMFWVPAVLSLVVLVLTVIVVPESDVREHSGRIDLVGATLLGCGVSGILLGVSFGPTWGWASGGVLLAFAVGVVMLVAWVIQAQRVTDPLVDLREISRVPLLMTMLTAAIAAALSSWWYAILPTVVLHAPTDGWGLGLDSAGHALLAALWTFGSAIAGFIVGYLLNRLSGPTVSAIFLTALAVAFGIGFFGSTIPWLTAAVTLLIGLSGSAATATAFYLVMRQVAPNRQGVTSSIATLVLGLVSGVLPIVAFTVMGAVTPVGGTYGYPAFVAAITIPFAMALAGLACAIVLRATLPASAAAPVGRLLDQADERDPAVAS